MKKAYFSLITGILLSFAAMAQPNEYKVADSMLSKYFADTSLSNAKKIDHMVSLFVQLPPNRLIKIAVKMDSLGVIHGDSLLGYSANGMYCLAFMNMGMLDSALKYEKRAFAMAEKYASFDKPEKKLWKARGLRNLSMIGRAYEAKGDLPAALECYQKCLLTAEDIGNYPYDHYFLLNIGNLHQGLENHAKADEYYELSEKKALENGDTLFILGVQNARACMYSNMKEYDMALVYFYQLLKNVQKHQLYDRVMITHRDIGSVYCEMDMFDSSLVHYEAALRIMELLTSNVIDKTMNSNIGDSIRLFIKIGELYTETGDYNQAFRFLDRAAVGINNIQNVGMKYDYYRAMYLVMSNQGYFKQATVYNDSAWVLRDSVFSIEKNNAVEELQTKYDTEKKEQQIVALETKNQLNELRLGRSRLIFWGIILLLLILLFSGILLFRQHRLKNLQKTLTLEQKLLRTQMNPHFIFNSLASIQNFIVIQDAVKASVYLSRFSDLVRSILMNSVEEFVSLEKEIKTIENYLELQKIRFPDKFNYSLEVDNTIDIDSIQIPPMLAQPFIENSIEHGIKHKKETGQIDISFTLKDDTILFEVKDDGVGRAKAQKIEVEKRSGHRSMATSITTDRLKALNKKLRKKIQLNITDLKSSIGEPEGTLVMIEIPFKLV